MVKDELVTKADLEPFTKAFSDLTDTLKAFVRQTELSSVYTNDTLAKELKVSKRTLQGWRDSGKISFSKVGRIILYRRQDVEKLLFESSNELFDEGFGRSRVKIKKNYNGTKL